MLFQQRLGLVIGLVVGVSSWGGMATAETLLPTPRNFAPENRQNSSLNAWENIELLRTMKGETTVANTLVFSPDGKMLASGGGYNDGQFRLWWVNTGTLIDHFRAHRTAVSAMVLSPNGKYLVSGGLDGAINVWEWETGEYVHTFLDHTSNILSMAISPDSEVLVSAGLDGLRVWNLTTQRSLYTLSRFEREYSVAIHPNGYILISGDKEGYIKFWNLRTGELLSRFLGHNQEVSAIALNQDGTTLVTGSEDGTVKVWNLETGQLNHTLVGHTGKIRALTINPTDFTLASASNDGVRLWNLSTGQLLNTITAHGNWVGSLAFSPDGTVLATGGFGSQVFLWQNVVSPSPPNVVVDAVKR